MKRLGLSIALLIAMACGPELPPSPEGVPPLAALPPVPIPADNVITPAKVELGRLLYFDTRLSGDAAISCATCHLPELGWGDGNGVSVGYPGARHWRNSQTVVNSAYLQKLFWAGESPSLETQAESAITGNLAGNGDPIMIEERLAQVPEYVELFTEAFGIDRPAFPHVLKAIATYERAELISDDSPFDRYMRGEQGALSEEARRGLALFQGKARCIHCHNGPLATDESFHGLGVPHNAFFDENILGQVAFRYQHYSRGVDEDLYRGADRDLGLYYTTKRDPDKGKFRTPPLRYLVYTGPYMHNGVFASLDEVVDFYNRGGGADPNKSPLLQPLGLADRERQDLVAFLESLSGTELILDAPTQPRYGVME